MTFKMGTGTKKAGFFFALTLCISCLQVQRVAGVPYMLFTHTGTKCIAVDALRNTNLILQYDAPDMVIIEEDDSKKDEGEKKGSDPRDPLEERYQRHMDEKLQKIKQRQQEMKDISIVISSRTSASVWLDPEVRKQPPRQLRTNLKEKSGTIEFYTGDFDGPVDICIRSLYASRSSPSRFSLLIRDQFGEGEDDDSEEAKERKKKQEEERERRKLDQLEQQSINKIEEEGMIVQSHFSSLSNELSKIENMIQRFSAEADYTRTQESAFFDDGVKMHKAVHFWPMIHIVILILGGIYQAKHIVSFFQMRHIY